jgi:hypothetical protein
MIAPLAWPEISIDCEQDTRVLEAGLEAVRQSQELLDSTPATLQGMIRARENPPRHRFEGPFSERSNRAVCPLQHISMNTYHAICTKSGRWVVEWAVDGGVIGHVPGTFDTKVEAFVAAFSLTRLEWAEGA